MRASLNPKGYGSKDVPERLRSYPLALAGFVVKRSGLTLKRVFVGRVRLWLDV